MTDNKQQIDGIEKIGTDSNPSSKRRMLMKGAVGTVPLVLTLSSGAAFATASGGCIAADNTTAGNNPPPIILEGSDTWLRQTIWMRVLTSVTNPSDTFRVYHRTSQDGNAQSNWFREDAYVNENYTYTVATNLNDPLDLNEYMIQWHMRYDLYTFGAAMQCQILVQINPSTNLNDPFVLGASIPNHNGSLPYVSQSCWASVSP